MSVTLVVGRLGCGKTYFAGRMADHYRRVVYVSTFPEFGAPVVSDIRGLTRHEIVSFSSDDWLENEIAIRYAYERGDGLLVVDEAHVYAESTELQRVVRYSRHRRLDVVLISHGFFDFARVNRQLFHTLILFNIREPYDLSYLERLHPGVRGQVTELKPREFLVIGEFPDRLEKELRRTKGGWTLAAKEENGKEVGQDWKPQVGKTKTVFATHSSD